jgi:hypothetical protein
MSRTVLGSLVFLLFLASAVAPAAAEGEKAVFKVGLVTPPPPKPLTAKEAETASQVLSIATKAFINARRFTIVERKELAIVFKEKDLKNFLSKGQGDNRLSDLLGLDYLGIVEHSVSTKTVPKKITKKLFEKLTPKENPNEEVKITVWTIDIRLVDVKTGQAVKALTSAASSSLVPVPTVTAAGELLQDAIRTAYPPFGHIVKVEGKDVVIDLGDSSGLQKKDVFDILEEGEQLFHPITGKPMEPYLVVIGQFQVTEIWPTMAHGKITVSEQGKVIKAGSFIRYKSGSGGFLKNALKHMTR